MILSKGGVLSQHALQVVSQHALQQVSRGWVPAPGGGVCSWGGLLLGVPGGDPPATAAGGTHPTGMHSCFQYVCFSMTHVYVSEIWREYMGVEGLDLTPQLTIPVRGRDIQAMLLIDKNVSTCVDANLVKDR